MKNLAAIHSKHPVKSILSFIYYFPAALLLIVIAVLFKTLLGVPETDKSFYWAGICVLALLVILLLIARVSSLPAYSFDLYENGINILFRKKSKGEVPILFEDIAEVWTLSIPQTVDTNYIAFKSLDSDYYLISTKYADSKSFIKYFLEKYQEIKSPLLIEALQNGERLTFSTLPADGEKVIISAKAIIPYLQNAQLQEISLDKFSLFDGSKAFGLSDIGKVESVSGEINILTVSGNRLYSKPYMSICNADLFIRSLNTLTTQG